MENLTYRSYCEDPAVRERIDEEVQQLRDEAVRLYIVRPLAALFDHSVDMVHAAFSLRGFRGWKST